MIDTERRWLMRRPGSELVVRNVVSWRTVRGYEQAVTRKLRLNWSPEQMAGWLKRAYPEDEALSACHTRRSIAAYLFKHAACLRKSCFGHLRSKRTIRRSKRAEPEWR